jgi:hypothetical protein
MNYRIPVGTRVQVSEGSGLASNKRGVVVAPSNSILKKDGRGVPQMGQGHYHAFNPMKEAVIRYDNGEYNTMFWDRLRRVCPVCDKTMLNKKDPMHQH